MLQTISQGKSVPLYLTLFVDMRRKGNVSRKTVGNGNWF